MGVQRDNATEPAPQGPPVVTAVGAALGARAGVRVGMLLVAASDRRGDLRRVAGPGDGYRRLAAAAARCQGRRGARLARLLFLPPPADSVPAFAELVAVEDHRGRTAVRAPSDALPPLAIPRRSPLNH